MFLGEARVPEGRRIYAIGDVHGRFDCLRDMLARIEADLNVRPTPEHRVIFLGDYTDRGPQSCEVLDHLSGLAKSPDHVFLLGNHDEWLRDFLGEPEMVGAHFLRWGGLETLQSYGIARDMLRRPHGEIARELARRMPQTHRCFLRNLVVSHIEGDYFFCHAGVRPGIPLEQQVKDDLIWIRDEFLGHSGSFGKVVVHGHTPKGQVDILPNRINVDTCAFDTGILSCLVLEGRDQRLLQTK